MGCPASACCYPPAGCACSYDGVSRKQHVAATGSSTAALEAPLTVRLPAVDFERSDFIEIRNKENRRLITVIQQLGTVPLILKAETYEKGHRAKSAEPPSAPATVGHSHAESAVAEHEHAAGRRIVVDPGVRRSRARLDVDLAVRRRRGGG